MNDHGNNETFISSSIVKKSKSCTHMGKNQGIEERNILEYFLTCTFDQYIPRLCELEIKCARLRMADVMTIYKLKHDEPSCHK